MKYFTRLNAILSLLTSFNFRLSADHELARVEYCICGSDLIRSGFVWPGRTWSFGGPACIESVGSNLDGPDSVTVICGSLGRVGSRTRLSGLWLSVGSMTPWLFVGSMYGCYLSGAWLLVGSRDGCLSGPWLHWCSWIKLDSMSPDLVQVVHGCLSGPCSFGTAGCHDNWYDLWLTRRYDRAGYDGCLSGQWIVYSRSCAMIACRVHFKNTIYHSIVYVVELNWLPSLRISFKWQLCDEVRNLVLHCYIRTEPTGCWIIANTFKD